MHCLEFTARQRYVVILLAVTIGVLLMAIPRARADTAAPVYLPLIRRSAMEGPRRVHQLNIEARLAAYKPMSDTCDLNNTLVDGAAQIRIVDVETGEVLVEGSGEAEYATRRDIDLAYGVHFDPDVAPRRLCPNLIRYAEEFVNINGVYEIVEVFHYDPTR